MEKVEVKDYEKEFLQLMGIECVNDSFIRTVDGSKFKFVNSEVIDCGSGEKNIRYKYEDNDVTIEFVRTNYNILLSSVCVTRGGYNYYASEYSRMKLCIGISENKKDAEFRDAADVVIRVENPEHALVITELRTLINRECGGISLLCSPYNVHTYAYYAGCEGIQYLGEENDYSKEVYTDILGNAISKIPNEEFRKFFLTFLSTTSRVSHDTVKSFSAANAPKLVARKLSFNGD